MAQVHVATTGSRSCGCYLCLQTPLAQGQIGCKTHGQPLLKTKNVKNTNSFPEMSTILPSGQGESSGKQGEWDIQPLQTNLKGKEPEPRTNSNTAMNSSIEDEQNSSDDYNTTSDDSTSEEDLPESIFTRSPERNGSVSQVEELEAEIGKQTKAKLDLREKIKEKDRKIDDLNKQIEKLQKQQVKSDSSSEIARLEYGRNSLRTLCNELISDKKDLTKKLKKAYSKIERLEAQLHQLRQRQRNGDKHAEELQEKLDITKRELTEIKAERDDYAKRASSSQVLVEDGDTIEQLETTAAVTTPQETVNQAHPRTSPPLASTILQESSQKAASHRRSSSGSKHSHSSKKGGKVTGSFDDIFGRGTKKQIACPR